MRTTDMIVLGAIILLIAIIAMISVFTKSYGELPCVDLSKPMAQHIHVMFLGITLPQVTGVIDYFGGTDTCMREMHTHYDVPIVHLESNNANTTFTLRPFMDLIGESTMGYSSLTINGKNATFDTALHDQDKIVIQ